MIEQNIDEILVRTKGYNFLFDSEKNQSIIMVYESDADAKVIKINNLGVIIKEKTVSNDALSPSSSCFPGEKMHSFLENLLQD